MRRRGSGGSAEAAELLADRRVPIHAKTASFLGLECNRAARGTRPCLSGARMPITPASSLPAAIGSAVRMQAGRVITYAIASARPTQMTMWLVFTSRSQTDQLSERNWSYYPAGMITYCFQVLISAVACLTVVRHVVIGPDHKVDGHRTLWCRAGRAVMEAETERVAGFGKPEGRLREAGAWNRRGPDVSERQWENYSANSEVGLPAARPHQVPRLPLGRRPGRSSPLPSAAVTTR